jgi:hypothetical protein
MKYIDDLFAQEEVDMKKWKNSKKTPLLSVWTKDEGSLHS